MPGDEMNPNARNNALVDAAPVQARAGHHFLCAPRWRARLNPGGRGDHDAERASGSVRCDTLPSARRSCRFYEGVAGNEEAGTIFFKAILHGAMQRSSRNKLMISPVVPWSLVRQYPSLPIIAAFRKLRPSYGRVTRSHTDRSLAACKSRRSRPFVLREAPGHRASLHAAAAVTHGALC